MNIDFQNHAGFSFYVIMLMVAGLACLITGAAAAGRNVSRGLRIWNVILGLGLLGYGIYLAFIFEGGHYFIFFYAFILPILTIVRTVKANNASNANRPDPAAHTH
jgi:peptidoglycan/LPS O-acetylase OafA/YrhL